MLLEKKLKYYDDMALLLGNYTRICLQNRAVLLGITGNYW